MGQTFSMMPTTMRLASRDVCDDITWTNTWKNRSQLSVSEQLEIYYQQEEEQEMMSLRNMSKVVMPVAPERAVVVGGGGGGRRGRGVGFAERVVVFEVGRVDERIESDNESV